MLVALHLMTKQHYPLQLAYHILMHTTCVVSDSHSCLFAECCIFHKQKSFGDWSDNDSDDECNDCNKQADCDQSDDKQEAQS